MSRLAVLLLALVRECTLGLHEVVLWYVCVHVCVCVCVCVCMCVQTVYIVCDADRKIYYLDLHVHLHPYLSCTCHMLPQILLHSGDYTSGVEVAYCFTLQCMVPVGVISP